MSMEDHIEALRARHRTLEQAIDRETRRPSPNLDAVSTLKRQKLRIKDELYSIKTAH